MTVDCNSRYVYANPQVGCAIAVAEAARNIVCSGGEPSAVTNCLNFGNPYNPNVYWQFVESIKGMSAACLKFETPVTGGNVSFYNQSSYEGPVFPTPTIGMIGILPDKHLKTGLGFKNEGDLIYLIGTSKNDISSSEYLYSLLGVKASPAPFFDLDEEYQVQQSVKALIKGGLVQSANDVSDGGLFVTLVESALAQNLGFEIFSEKNVRKDAFLFGESQSRIVVSLKKESESETISLLKDLNTKFTKLGFVTGSEFKIDNETFLTVADAHELYDNSLEKHLN